MIVNSVSETAMQGFSKRNLVGDRQSTDTGDARISCPKFSAFYSRNTSFFKVLLEHLHNQLTGTIELSSDTLRNYVFPGDMILGDISGDSKELAAIRKKKISIINNGNWLIFESSTTFA